MKSNCKKTTAENLITDVGIKLKQLCESNNSQVSSFE